MKEEKVDEIFYPDNVKHVKVREEDTRLKEQVKVISQNNKPVQDYHSYDVYGFVFDLPQWTIKVNLNEIFFSGDIVEQSMIELIEKVDEVFETIERLKRKTGMELPLKLMINSPGGSVKSGFMAIDYIKTLPVKIETYVLGQAASMGFMLWLIGDKRDMAENSTLLIHQLRTGFAGRKDELEDYMKHIGNLHNQLVNFTMKATGLGKEKVEELFSRETWLTRQEAKKLGLLRGV